MPRITISITEESLLYADTALTALKNQAVEQCTCDRADMPLHQDRCLFARHARGIACLAVLLAACEQALRTAPVPAVKLGPLPERRS